MDTLTRLRRISDDSQVAELKEMQREVVDVEEALQAAIEIRDSASWQRRKVDWDALLARYEQAVNELRERGIAEPAL